MFEMELPQLWRKEDPSSHVGIVECRKPGVDEAMNTQVKEPIWKSFFLFGIGPTVGVKRINLEYESRNFRNQKVGKESPSSNRSPTHRTHKPQFNASRKTCLAVPGSPPKT